MDLVGNQFDLLYHIILKCQWKSVGDIRKRQDFEILRLWWYGIGPQIRMANITRQKRIWRIVLKSTARLPTALFSVRGGTLLSEKRACGGGDQGIKSQEKGEKTDTLMFPRKKREKTKEKNPDEPCQGSYGKRTALAKSGGQDAAEERKEYGNSDS